MPVAAAGKTPIDKVAAQVTGTAKPLLDASKPGGRKQLVQRVTDPLAGREYRPPMDGDAPDFWEGTKFNPLGFFLQYFWAFGIVFALVACGYAVRTYNSGATDFKETEAFKEAVTATQGSSSSQSEPSTGQPPDVAAPDDAPPL